MTKEAWKQEVWKKIYIKTKQYLETEFDETKRYQSNVTDEIKVGTRKRYTNLTQKKAKIWFKCRADIIDPAPRAPYNPISKWKCKFCDARKQGTQHYVRECPGTAHVFEGFNRDNVYQLIQNLDGTEENLHQTTYVLEKMYNLVIE